MKWFTSLLAIGAVSGLGTAQPPGGQDEGGVPRLLLGKFKRGINVTRWFCYLKDPNDTGHFQNYLVEQDFQEFKKLQVSWIRLCVSPEAIYQDGSPNPKNLLYLDEALEKLEKRGLAVSLDLHDRGQLKLDEPGHDNDGFVAFWQSMARHYRGKNEDSVVFELVNEPKFRDNPQVWYDLQSKTVAAVRAIDPKRTMMVSGTRYSGIDQLGKVPPLPQKNLFYTVHSYDPFTFTHQGAGWSGDPPKGIQGLTFPSSPENVQDAIAKSTPQDEQAIKTYGAKRYDAAYLKSRLEKAAEYGKLNHVPIVLGEFGSYPKVAPVDARERWFEAMGSAIDEVGLANSLWGYDDSEGLGRRLGPDGKLELDEVTLRSLYKQ